MQGSVLGSGALTPSMIQTASSSQASMTPVDPSMMEPAQLTMELMVPVSTSDSPLKQEASVALMQPRSLRIERSSSMGASTSTTVEARIKSNPFTDFDDKEVEALLQDNPFLKSGLANPFELEDDWSDSDEGLHPLTY